jgi:hypothetical protein
MFGGNDLDKWSDFASGVDVDDFDIASDFSIRSGKSKLRNPANTFDYVEIASAITNTRNVTEPLLTANDTRVYENHTQSISNKTVGTTLKYTKQGSTPADQTNIEDIMVYNKAFDANNNALFIKYKENGAIVTLRLF